TNRSLPPLPTRRSSDLQNERVQTAEAVALAKIGEANALQNERIQISAANAKAIDGENTARIEIAESDALRREKQAEAEKRAISRSEEHTSELQSRENLV